MRVQQATPTPRKTYRLGSFMGVDYSSSPLDVSPGRATHMSNFICENGITRKRPGWREILHISNARINGIWDFKVVVETDGVKSELDRTIVHAGTDIYEVDLTNHTARCLSSELTDIQDARSYGVVQSNKLYILCGDYLVYGQFTDSDGAWELRRVENNADTYVPTTTVGIGYVGENRKAQTLDKVNFLTNRRKNKFIYNKDRRTYRVDSKQIDDGPIVLTFSYLKNNEIIEVKATDVYDRSTDSIKLLDEAGKMYGYVSKGAGIVDCDRFPEEADGAEFTLEFTFLPKSDELGRHTIKGKTFEYIEDGSYTGFGDTRKFCMYPMIPYLTNDVHAVNAVDGFIYFTDGTLDYGHAALKGGIDTTSLTPDGKLLVDSVYIGDIKDNRFEFHEILVNDYTRNKYGKTLKIKRLEVTYPYRIPEEKVAKPIEDYARQITGCKFGALFGAEGHDDRLFIAGNPEHPNICFHSSIDDFTYFPDENTAACGNSSSAVTGFTRMNDGTLAVLKEASGHDASVYYRSGVVRQKTEETLGQTYAEEIFPVRAGAIGVGCVTPWANANLAGDNVFLSDSGLYGIVLTGNVATDERVARERSRLIDARLSRHALSDAAGIAHGNKYYLSVDGECYVADARYKTSGKGDLDDTFNYEWWHWDNIPARVWAVIGGELYFGTNDGGICTFDGEFTDRRCNRAVLSIGSGDMTVAGDGTITINKKYWQQIRDCDYISVNGVRYHPINLDEAARSFQLALLYETETVTLTPAEEYVFEFVSSVPVKAEWYSPVLDLGSDALRKTLHSLSLSVQPVKRGSIRFGYKTRTQEALSFARGARSFGFDDVDFTDFSFETNDFMSSYTRRLKVRNFNYIMFRFAGESDGDCIVNSMTAEYSVLKKNLGVR